MQDDEQRQELISTWRTDRLGELNFVGLAVLTTSFQSKRVHCH